MFMWSKAPSSTWYNNYNDNCIWKCFFVNNNYLFVVCIIFSSKNIKAFDCCCWCSIIIIWEMSNCCWLCFCCCYITFSMLACCCCICICCFLKTSIFSLSSSWCSFLIFRSSSFSWSLTLALSAKSLDSITSTSSLKFRFIVKVSVYRHLLMSLFSSSLTASPSLLVEHLPS